MLSSKDLLLVHYVSVFLDATLMRRTWGRGVSYDLLYVFDLSLQLLLLPYIDFVYSH